MYDKLYTELYQLMDRGQLDRAIALIEGTLQQLPATDFHTVIGRNFLHCTDDTMNFIEAFYNQAKEHVDVKALHIEMGEFAVNNEYWYIDAFAYDSVGDPTTSDWHAYWQYCNDADDSLVLLGLEDIQAVFKEEDRDRANCMVHEIWWNNTQDIASTICNFLIIARLQEMVREAVRRGREQGFAWARLPLSATAHDCDIIYKMNYPSSTDGALSGDGKDGKVQKEQAERPASEGSVLALHNAGAVVRHHSPFNELVSHRNASSLSQDFREEWAIPFYMNTGRTDRQWVNFMRTERQRITPEIVFTLLGDYNWRLRRVGAFFAAVQGYTECIDVIGTHLLKSEVCCVGDEYATALAWFHTPESIAFMEQYLEYYFQQPSLYFDQREVMNALYYVDILQGTNYTVKHQERWAYFVAHRKNESKELDITHVRQRIQALHDIREGK